MHNRNRAFTLVELLIVIVVIAILAAISVVAYNGIQDRAQISKIATTVDSYVKTLQLYQVYNGHFPLTDTESGRACLSPAGSLPAQGDFGLNQCSTGEFPVVLDSQLSSDLALVATNLPDADFPPIDTGAGGDQFRSIIYWPRQSGAGAFVDYYIDGKFDCPTGAQSDYPNGTTRCSITLGSPWGGTS